MSEFSKEDLERKITLAAGDTAPNFTLENSDGVSISLKDFVGKNVVLYFYPKDNTPGCTTEACEFSALYDDFIAKDTVIVGVSPDSIKSHAGFAQKQGLKHILLSDPAARSSQTLRRLASEKKLRQRVSGHRALDLCDRQGRQDREGV